MRDVQHVPAPCTCLRLRPAALPGRAHQAATLRPSAPGLRRRSSRGHLRHPRLSPGPRDPPGRHAQHDGICRAGRPRLWPSPLQPTPSPVHRHCRRAMASSPLSSWPLPPPSQRPPPSPPLSGAQRASNLHASSGQLCRRPRPRRLPPCRRPRPRRLPQRRRPRPRPLPPRRRPRPCCLPPRRRPRPRHLPPRGRRRRRRQPRRLPAEPPPSCATTAWATSTPKRAPSSPMASS
jgi:hypothetical protein